MKPRRVGDAVQESAQRMEEAGVAFGQGTTDAMQEALWMAARVLGRSWDELLASLDEPIAAARAGELAELTGRRITTRKPAAYLLNEAWIGPHRFYVDERVIVPRSFIGELLRHPRDLRHPREGGDPVDCRARGAARVLDLCTGSGCLAILAALRWPEAKIDAADISEEALAVARRNVAAYGLGRRVRLVKSDLFSALEGRTYDVILSNPPYVKASSMRKLPPEFRQEPVKALASGEDGLDHARVIVAESRRHLAPGGLLVVEIGHNRKALERSYPDLPFRWPEVSAGAGYVFTLNREELP